MVLVSEAGGEFAIDVDQRVELLWRKTGRRLFARIRFHENEKAAFDDTVKLLADLGHEVSEAAPPVEREAFSMAFLTALAGELRADIEFTAKTFGVKIRPGDYDASSFGMGLLGEGFTASDLITAHRYLTLSARSILGFFEDVDVLMTPVLSTLPVRIGALQPSASEKKLLTVLGYVGGGRLLKKLGIAEQLAAQTFEFIPWTPVFNVTGQPAALGPCAGGLCV